MEPAKLLEQLFDRKILTLVKLFLDNPERQYGLREAAKATKLPPATAHRLIHRLVDLEILQETRIKQLRLYKLSNNKATKFLDEMMAVKKSAIEDFVDSAATLAGVQEIIQHGKATKDKVNLLIIGESIDSAALAHLVGDIKENYNFTILHLVLSPDQYQQMASMGLYEGEKKILSRR